MGKITQQPDLKIEQIAKALKKTNGIQAQAAKLLGVTQPAISMRIKRSKILQNVCEEISEQWSEVAESIIFHHMLKLKSLPAAMFYLKHKGSGRGYGEKHFVDTTIHLSHDDWIKKLDEPQ
jgi:predicted transcriptional regulator